MLLLHFRLWGFPEEGVPSFPGSSLLAYHDVFPSFWVLLLYEILFLVGKELKFLDRNPAGARAWEEDHPPNKRGKPEGAQRGLLSFLKMRASMLIRGRVATKS